MEFLKFLKYEKIFSRYNIHIHEIITILMFAIFGNLVFSIEIDFKSSFDAFLFLKVVLICFSSISYYLIVFELKSNLKTSIDDFNTLTVKDQALPENSVDAKYLKKLKDNRKIFYYTLISIISIVCYFFLKPIYNFL